MTQYLQPKARNTRTGQTVKSQDLTGGRFALHQRALAQERADQLATQLSERTGDGWVGFLEAYTPTERRSAV
jgi:hypothetical protein